MPDQKEPEWKNLPRYTEDTIYPWMEEGEVFKKGELGLLRDSIGRVDSVSIKPTKSANSDNYISIMVLLNPKFERLAEFRVFNNPQYGIDQIALMGIVGSDPKDVPEGTNWTDTVKAGQHFRFIQYQKEPKDWWNLAHIEPAEVDQWMDNNPDKYNPTYPNQNRGLVNTMGATPVDTPQHTDAENKEMDTVLDEVLLGTPDGESSDDGGSQAFNLNELVDKAIADSNGGEKSSTRKILPTADLKANTYTFKKEFYRDEGWLPRDLPAWAKQLPEFSEGWTKQHSITWNSAFNSAIGQVTLLEDGNEDAINRVRTLTWLYFAILFHEDHQLTTKNTEVDTSDSDLVVTAEE